MVKTGIKIKVTPEHSAKIQQICFDNGFYWASKSYTIKHLNEPYLFIDESCLSASYGLDFFKKHKFTEVSAELFIDTEGTCEDADKALLKNKFMKLIDKRNKANKKLRKFAKKYNLEELI